MGWGITAGVTKRTVKRINSGDIWQYTTYGSPYKKTTWAYFGQDQQGCSVMIKKFDQFPFPFLIAVDLRLPIYLRNMKIKRGKSMGVHTRPVFEINANRSRVSTLEIHTIFMISSASHPTHPAGKVLFGSVDGFLFSWTGSTLAGWGRIWPASPTICLSTTKTQPGVGPVSQRLIRPDGAAPDITKIPLGFNFMMNRPIQPCQILYHAGRL